jgi:hypothetical protein
MEHLHSSRSGKPLELCMSAAKELMIHAEDNRRWALSVLAEAGVLECCEAHSEYYYDGGNEVQEAYKLANAKITAGNAPFSPDERREATDAIKSAFESHDFVDGCRSCEKLMAD